MSGSLALGINTVRTYVCVRQVQTLLMGSLLRLHLCKHLLRRESDSNVPTVPTVSSLTNGDTVPRMFKICEPLNWGNATLVPTLSPLGTLEPLGILVPFNRMGILSLEVRASPLVLSGTLGSLSLMLPIAPVSLTGTLSTIRVFRFESG